MTGAIISTVKLPVPELLYCRSFWLKIEMAKIENGLAFFKFSREGAINTITIALLKVILWKFMGAMTE
jgi:hypothetical protein